MTAPRFAKHGQLTVHGQQLNGSYGRLLFYDHSGVAALETNTFEDRRAIYNRARAVQSYQLGRRPFNKKDFDFERSTLEDAISRVETETTSKRITTEASPNAPMTPLPSVGSWLKRVFYRFWGD